MDTKKLRQKILDLAIRGKLVPQDPNDEPASVLLERIRAEKERLIKEGKIKRSKKSASDDEIEAPFEIPESWEWVRLDDIAESNIGLTYKPTDISNEGVPVYRSNNILNRLICKDDIVRVNTQILDKQYLHEGDLLICARNGSRNLVGKCALIPKLTEPTSFGAFMAVCRSHYNKWIFLMLNSEYFNTYLDDSNSTTINQVTQKMLLSFRLPFPPVNEQERIYDTVCKYFTLIDELESNEGDLLKAIDKAKSKILALSIHGKLVPQDPNDEPAIDLLKRINPKFEPCDMEECPFAIPQSWEWVSGIDIFESMKSSSPSGETFKYIDIDAVDNKCHQIISIKHIQTKEAPSRASRYTERGNVLFSMVRPYLRNIAMVPEDGCIASTGFFVCREKTCLNNSFCLYLMLSNYVVDGLNAFMKGDNSPSINKSQIESFLFPLPPYAEQLRIVAKIEELVAVLDSIKESLEV